ncbi:hypothetical protein SAMN04487906_0006 [Zhouia amylolytica]|uniref:Uncharacterized protein n=1 Tax=Zhouia amylolytica TaxID=376730 RepID=A0A1I6NXY4_9FLAO|nr:hypothetical protein [Zhouia amylolytica]MCQ0112471.1 hypothetical protein [Zhouia amylolytica]SFS32755.1 hypothetical protein SAMN04487906_0006 [Zhouia amylolytica]
MNVTTLKKTKLVLRLHLIALIFMLYACQNNSDLHVEDNINHKLSEGFHKEEFKEIIPYEYSVDWNNYAIGYSEEMDSEYYEFTLNWLTEMNPIDFALNGENTHTFPNYKLLANGI